jgi:hypothetical protein
MDIDILQQKQFRIVLKRGYFVGGRLKNGYRFTL